MPKPYTSRAEYYYGALTEGYDGDLPRPQSREDYYLLKLIDQMNKISGQTVFTPRGTVQDVMALPSLTDATAGDIYNIKVDSKTTSDFVEGSGVTIKGGSNVYCVLDDSNNKKWDCLGTTYAVDHALDPGSGSPIANDAVCTAIDNITDQLNPAFVERHVFSEYSDLPNDPNIIANPMRRLVTLSGSYNRSVTATADMEYRAVVTLITPPSFFSADKASFNDGYSLDEASLQFFLTTSYRTQNLHDPELSLNGGINREFYYKGGVNVEESTFEYSVYVPRPRYALSADVLVLAYTNDFITKLHVDIPKVADYIAGSDSDLKQLS